MKLFEYQEQYLADMPKNCIMAADVGLGKTLMALEHYRRWNYEYVAQNTKRWGDLVIVAPASKVKTNDWQNEVNKYLKMDAAVVSYEYFSKHWMSLTGPATTIIFDEAHYLCNATSKRGKTALKAMSIARQWIMLTATPLPNGWRSAATYAIATGLARNKTAFFDRFVITDRSRGFPIIMGYREQSVLEEWWASIAKPLKRTGDLKLPSQMIPVEPKMDPTEAKTYKRAVKERMLGEDMLDSPSKLFTALRQIPILSRVHQVSELIEQTDEHIVIFYNFNSERDYLIKMLESSYPDRTLYEQSGHKSHLPPRDEWATMKPSITLAQYQSAAQAIELTYASITIYASPPTSYANYEQSKGRTRRHGQERTTLFYHIAVEGSIDRHIWKIVGKKQQFSTKIVEKVLDNI